MRNLRAREGQWYADRATHDVFCVIAVDEDDGYVDVRDSYGDIDEFDLEEWRAMDLELCSAPKDWNLPLAAHGAEPHAADDDEEKPAANDPIR